jgi:hypothetical protein
VNGLKHQKEKRGMDHFAGLIVAVKDASALWMTQARSFAK